LTQQAAAEVLVAPEYDETSNFEIMYGSDEHYFVYIVEKHKLPWKFRSVMYDKWTVVKSIRPYFDGLVLLGMAGRSGCTPRYLVE
jgi:hypothetical protein